MTPATIVHRWLRPRESTFLVAMDVDAVSGQETALLGCVAVKMVHTLHSERLPGVPVQPGEASVWRLTTVPAARGRGVGRALMTAAEEWAAAQGAHHVSLITGNIESKAFYRRIGYQAEELPRAAAVVFGTPHPNVPCWNVRRWVQAHNLARRCGPRTTIFARCIAPPPTAALGIVGADPATSSVAAVQDGAQVLSRRSAKGEPRARRVA